MKPVVLPMLHLLLLLAGSAMNSDGDGLARDVGLLAAGHSQHALEFVRENFDEARRHLVPVVENPFGAAAGSQLPVDNRRSLTICNIRLIEQGLRDRPNPDCIASR